MDDGLLLTIKKLGHQLEEIRVRALESLITKLDLHILTVDNLIEQPELFPLLVQWFESKKSPKKSLVLNFILRLLKGENAINLLLYQDQNLEKLRKWIGPDETDLFRQICLIADVDPNFTAKVDKTETKKAKEQNGYTIKEPIKNVYREKVLDSDLSSESSINSLPRSKPWSPKKTGNVDALPRHELSFHSSLVSDQINLSWNQVYWPSPCLADSDKKVIATLKNSLKDPNQQNQAIKFFSTVILHDFPPQVFLNNPSILMILLDILENNESNEYAMSCLEGFTAALLKHFQFYSDPSVISPNCFITEGSVDEEVDTQAGGDFLETEGYLQSLKSWRFASHVLSVGDYCALVLDKIGPLTPGILSLLELSISDAETFWNSTLPKAGPLKHSINSVLSSLGHNLLRMKGIGPFVRLRTQLIVANVLKVAVPESVSLTVVPKELQQAMAESLVDPILFLLHPKIYKFFLCYVKEFKYQDSNEFKEFIHIAKSLKAGAKFLKTSNEMGISELLTVFKEALPAIEIHQEYRILEIFINAITTSLNLCASELETIQDLFVKLLASSDNKLKLITYKVTSSLVNKHLGPAANCNNTNHYEPLIFLLNKKVLKEIIFYGLKSDVTEVRFHSETILVLIIKSQMLVSISSWRWLISEISPLFSVLQAYADMNSPLGRSILGMLDPDTSKQMTLSFIEVLTGNIRLMMSKNADCRNEATARVIFLLNIPSHIELSQSFCLGENPSSTRTAAFGEYEEGSLIRVIEVLKSNPDDLKIVKSALTQLSLIMEDYSLHVTFLEYQGLDVLYSLLHSCTENITEDSKAIFTPVVVTYKHIARFNAQLRLEFSSDEEMYSSILKGIFIYNADWRLLRDVSQLLTLMVFADVVTTTTDSICLPEIIIERMKLPFDVKPHSQVSPYYEASQKGDILQNKTLMASFGLVWYVAVTEGGIKNAVLSLDATTKHVSSSLKVSPLSLEQLKITYIPVNIENLLISLSCSNSHTEAEKLLQQLKKYMHLGELSEFPQEIGELPWQRTFSRYLTTLPASGLDQLLLANILRFLCYSARLLPTLIPWLSGIVKDPAFTLNSLLTKLTVSDNTSLGKELSISILSLVEICLKNSDSEGWDYVISTLLQCLSHSHTQKFYSIAVMDKLLTCLLKITELNVQFSPKSLWQLLNAFHCSTPYSCMGLTITRQAVLCLCKLLALRSKGKKAWFPTEVKWLEKMLESKDLIVKAATLELLSGLCVDFAQQIISQFPKLWDISLSVLLDHNEASMLREQAAYLCTNLFCTIESRRFLLTCIESDFFSCVTHIALKVHYSSTLDQSFMKNVLGMTFSSNQPDDGGIYNITTPKLFIATCHLILNLMAKEKNEIIEAAHSKGLVVELFRQVSQWQSCKTICNQERVDLYVAICKILNHCTHYPATAVKDCIPTLVWLLQDSTYCEEVKKNELVTESLHLLGSIVCNQKNVDILFTREAIDSLCQTARTEDGTTATAISHLIPFLSSDANVEIVKGIGKCPLSHRFLLASILGSSHAGTKTALECGLLEPLIIRLKETHVNLAVMPPDIPRSKKANIALHSLSIDFTLMANFLAGSIETKELCVKFGLADIIHKLWVWCLLDFALLSMLLQVLITFTANSPAAASSLVLTSTMVGVGQRKTPTSNSLLHAVIGLLSKDIYGLEIKKLILELLSHACQAVEARTIMSKTPLLSEFLKLGNAKRSSLVENMEILWLQFLVIFSYFQEGQAALMKNDDFIEQLMEHLVSNKIEVRSSALSILRNLTFNPANKHRFIAADKLLKIISERTTDMITEGELRDILLIAWYLAANTQRGKYAVRNVNLDARLQSAVASYSDKSEIFQLAQVIFPIIKPP